MFAQSPSMEAPHPWMSKFDHRQWWPWKTSSDHQGWHCFASSDPSSLTWVAILCWSPWWIVPAHLQIRLRLWWEPSWSMNVHGWWSESPQTWCTKPCNNKVLCWKEPSSVSIKLQALKLDNRKKTIWVDPYMRSMHDQSKNCYLLCTSTLDPSCVTRLQASNRSTSGALEATRFLGSASRVLCFCRLSKTSLVLHHQTWSLCR
jgi:hypothetical protein